MSDVVISVENVSKAYQLGVIGTGTFYGDVQRWWARMRGLPDPFAKIGEKDHGNRYGEIVMALQDVSFQVRQGEAVGIIGRNGAGKSTLLKILSRVTSPTSGALKAKGMVSSLLEVGTGFHPELTGRENIFMNGAIMGMDRSEINRKFDEIVDFSGVETYIDTPVKRYSSGMYVRLAFAVAAHLEPDILVVDEVLAVGDAEFQKKCLGKMDDVSRKEGRTILFVSHNMLAIKSLCNTAIHLDHGKVLGSGEVTQIVQEYLQKSSISLRQQVWDDPQTAPGNESASLHRVCVEAPGIKEDEPFTIESPINIEFEIWNKVDGAILNFVLYLFTVDGVHIMSTSSIPYLSRKGLARAVTQIPANFLNDGSYRVGVLVVHNSKKAYYNPEVLTFDVHDIPRTSGWMGKWPGIIRPQAEWIARDV